MFDVFDGDSDLNSTSPPFRIATMAPISTVKIGIARIGKNERPSSRRHSRMFSAKGKNMYCIPRLRALRCSLSGFDIHRFDSVHLVFNEPIKLIHSAQNQL